jgi:hypothetical protein
MNGKLNALSSIAPIALVFLGDDVCRDAIEVSMV